MGIRKILIPVLLVAMIMICSVPGFCSNGDTFGIIIRVFGVIAYISMIAAIFGGPATTPVAVIVGLVSLLVIVIAYDVCM